MNWNHFAVCMTGTLCLLLTACAGKSSNSTDPPVGQASLPAIHSIPFPDDRTATGLTEYLISGANAELSSVGAVPSGPALVLDASGAGGAAEWAVYRFNPGTNQQDSVSVLLDETLTTGAFIGLANYATQRWDFSGPYSGQKSFLTDSADYLSPAGNQWVAVLAPGGSSATVNALSIRTINPDNIAPTAALSASPLSGDAPLLVQFNASGSFDPDGSIIEYAWDWEGDGGWDTFTNGPLFSRTYTQPGIYNARVRVTDEQFARSTAASVQINVNGPPVAVLTTGTPVVDPGESVLLSAAGSHLPGGNITDYEWDLDGNGLFNSSPLELEAWGAAEAETVLDGGPGLRTAALRVTDSRGGQATAQLTLTIRGWLKLTVDAPGSVGLYSTLAVVNGKPAISYFDQTNTDLKYAWSTTADGSSGWTATTVDAQGNVGAHNSLAVVAGRPAISYLDVTNFDLKYAWSSTADGSGGWSTLTVDAPGNVGQWTSLATVAGRPAVSYYDSTNQNLKYAWSSTADGSSGWTATTVDSPSPGNVGQHSSLAELHGWPAVSYYDVTNGDLKYAWSNTADGGSGWNIVIVDAPDNVGETTSLAIIGGRPIISYFDLTNFDLKYA